MADKKNKPKEFSYTEYETESGTFVIGAMSDGESVSLAVGMLVIMGTRDQAPPKFNQPLKGENMVICGFSASKRDKSRTVRVHCCNEKAYADNIASTKATGTPLGKKFPLDKILYIGTKRPRNPFIS